MRSIFTTFASSRFVDQEAVIEALRRCAQQLKTQHPAEVVAIYLFGSFATGTATPRSDADIVVEICKADPSLRRLVWESATGIFLAAPIPVDLFVTSSAELTDGERNRRGVAGRVAREGLRLK